MSAARLAPVTVPSEVRTRPATRQDYVDLLTAIHANARAVQGVHLQFGTLTETVDRIEKKIDALDAKVDRLETKLTWRMDRLEKTLAAVARAVNAEPDA